MRYGLVRQIEGHPPVGLQRRRIERAGCDIVLEEGPPTRAALRAQWGLLRNLRPGDELLVCSLDTLQLSTGQLVLLLHRLDQTGGTLKIVGDDGAAAPALPNDPRRLLALLAGNEGSRPDARPAPARRRPAGKPLSRYQIDFANELRAGGASLRMLCQIFRVSPADLRRELDRVSAETVEAEVVVALPERRARKS